MCLEDTNWLSRLYQHGFVILQVRQGAHDGIEGFPVTGSFTGAAIDD
ncbi:unannotated protein [freshwater metagenome]|uniref:Unannotated protein n=1 Tax=freshwater metagenome TaxID=449393 RepID=A0A6J6YP67_9ZZZZ